jgi:hypothetical protein
MHNLTLDQTMPTFESTISILAKHNARFGIPLDFDRMVEYWCYYTATAEDYYRRIIDYTMTDGTKATPATFKDSDMRKWLKKNGMSTGFMLTGGNLISLSAESIDSAIATGTYSQEQVEILELYKKAAKANKAVSLFRNIMDTYPIAGIETWDNHRMIVVRPKWSVQNTGRIGASDPGVMNFPKALGDVFTVPKGFIYFEADSGQIEPRLTQSWRLKDKQLMRCTMMYNDAYFGYVHFCKYLTDEERRTGTLDLKPIEITDEQRERRKKFKTFGNAVMYGSTENIAKDPDKELFIKYIGGHPSRIKLQKSVEDMIERGERIFYTAFGTPIDITNGPSDSKYADHSSNEYFKHLVRNAINNPMQGTAADMMRFSVLKADSLLRRKAPNSIILQYVHDAGKFMIAESDYDNIIDELKEITSYQVEDWLPIYCDPVEGVHPAELKRFIA